MIKMFLIGFVMSALLAAQDITIDRSSVLSIHDGDTFTVDLPCKLDLVCKKIPVRVSGIDTAEMTSKNQHEKDLANKAKDFTMLFINRADKTVVLKDCKRDKYFRANCDVDIDGKLLSEELLKARLAKPYDGGTKNTDWSGY